MMDFWFFILMQSIYLHSLICLWPLIEFCVEMPEHCNFRSKLLDVDEGVSKLFHWGPHMKICAILMYQTAALWLAGQTDSMPCLIHLHHVVLKLQEMWLWWPKFSVRSIFKICFRSFKNGLRPMGRSLDTPDVKHQTSTQYNNIFSQISMYRIYITFTPPWIPCAYYFICEFCQVCSFLVLNKNFEIAEKDTTLLDQS